ncbi:MAG: hypothetical protein ACK47B_08635 [Armatimonadota bacterium]
MPATLPHPLPRFRPCRLARAWLAAAAMLILSGGGSFAAPPDPLPTDPKLAERITLRLRKAPLSRVLKEVSRETGAALSASAEVADEPAMLYVTDRPASEVLRQLALLFNYRWARRRINGAPTWQLYQDLKSRKEEEALRDGGRARALAALQSSLGEELRKTLEDPFPHRRSLLLAASLLRREHWQALAEGELLYFSSPSEPGSLPLAPEIAAGLRPGFYGENAVVRPTVGWRIRISLDLEPRGGQWTATLRAQASTIAAEGSTGPTPSGVSDLHLHGSDDPAVAERPLPGGAESHANSWREHQLLGRVLPAEELKLKSGAVLQPFDTAFDLAERGRIDVIAAAYHHPSTLGSSPAPPSEQALYAELQSWRFWSYRWRTSDAMDAGAAPFLLLRSRSWFLIRESEVPERVIQQWAGHLASRQSVSLDDATALALALNDGQLRQLPLRLDEEGIRLSRQIDSPDLLRCYGSLLPGQRAQLRAGGEVPYAAWPASARRYWRRIERGFRLGWLNEAPPAPANGRLRLRERQVQLVVAERSPEEVRYEYRVQDAEESGEVVGVGTDQTGLRFTTGRGVLIRAADPRLTGGSILEEGRLTHAVRFEYVDEERPYYPQLILPYVIRLPRSEPAPPAEPEAP